jgi:hypothetical protein
VNFADSDEPEGRALWSPTYPYGTQTIGLLIDTILHKAYKFLHGLSLTHALNSDSKESQANMLVPGSLKRVEFAPESASAAAVLYRCIIRAYSSGRKSPPKVALEFVLISLPAIEKSEKSEELHRFLFSSSSYFEVKDLPTIVTQASGWEKHFGSLERFLTNDSVEDYSKIDNEAMIVRRGVTHLLAQGSLPQYQDSGDQNDSRSQSVHAEEELSRKFNAIIEDLSFGDITNIEGWYKASQCIVMKAEMIADRLGLSSGYARYQNFSVAGNNKMAPASASINDLEIQQENETGLKRGGWVESLGTDLSLFVNHNWCSLKSLEDLSLQLRTSRNVCLSSHVGPAGSIQPIDDCEDLVRRGIDDLFDADKVIEWQTAWGGVYVSSLRKIARRCICMSLFVASKREDRQKNHLLVSEIIESLGIMSYSELMGSQTYGFPMHVTPDYNKREQATSALACFECTVATIERNEDQNHGRVTWDLYFMIGKVSERQNQLQ